MSQPPIGIVAGGGSLPERLAQALATNGRQVFILGVKGFVDLSLVQRFGGVEVSLGETGRQIDLLKTAGVVELVFAGIVKRPRFEDLKLDFRGARLLPRVIAAARKGDDALMRTMVNVFEEEGFRVVGANDLLGDIVVGPGPLGRMAPVEADWPDIRQAARIAGLIGAEDIGQGAVVCRGLVLAVEAQEGTDSMLERCATLAPEIRGHPDQRAGVLVKRPKPQQERRIDLPTIGLTTVERAAAAGLSGIAVEAQGALVIDRDAVRQAADQLGVFVYGYSASETA